VLAIQQKVVKVLLSTGLFERKDALHDYKENDADGEHVDLSALVLLALLDLRRHVRHGTAVGRERVDVLVAGKAEVGKLEVQVVVNENVLELQITVNHAALVHKID